jgi:predicted ABC-type exoprotein transport system permease subunit
MEDVLAWCVVIAVGLLLLPMIIEIATLLIGLIWMTGYFLLFLVAFPFVMLYRWVRSLR